MIINPSNPEAFYRKLTQPRQCNYNPKNKKNILFYSVQIKTANLKYNKLPSNYFCTKNIYMHEKHSSNLVENPSPSVQFSNKEQGPMRA